MTNSNEQNLEAFLQLSVFPKLRSKEVISLFHDLMRVATCECSVHQSLDNPDLITDYLYDSLQNQLEIIIEKTLVFARSRFARLANLANLSQPGSCRQLPAAAADLRQPAGALPAACRARFRAGKDGRFFD